MLTFLRSRIRSQRITVALVVLIAVGATCLAVLAVGEHSAPKHGAIRRPTHTAATHPRLATTSVPSGRASTSAPLARTLPQTASADVYAAAVAKALWNVDYSTTSRDAVLAFWRAQLSPVLPAGTPSGTTLAEAQNAAMSTLADLIPSAEMWPTLARDHTASSFTVTAVTEPPAWVEAVSTGKITDPGLTAREVIGVQKLTYGTGDQQETAQTQQLLVAMLCPPTTRECEVEVFPPPDASGTS